MLENVAHDAVPGAKVERTQLGEVLAGRFDRELQQVANHPGRVALEPVVKNLLVEAGAAVDRVVVVEPQADPVTVLNEVEEDLVLAERRGFDGRELDSVS
ncbi:hypothetical protein [Botrimarina colliarenosi]|uniref:hypothetical protein n=1 Tax=Botrimarina colliarenosi TaxID=2528001 RepID=UPI0018D33FEB|nr:hypothetical protein [Botrimarina colliarenosi]